MVSCFGFSAAFGLATVFGFDLANGLVRAGAFAFGRATGFARAAGRDLAAAFRFAFSLIARFGRRFLCHGSFLGRRWGSRSEKKPGIIAS